VLIDTEWLAGRLGDQDLVVVDLRWREDGSGRERHLEAHIPGAVHLDWATDLADPTHPVAFTLAPPERLEAILGAVGISDETVVVAYADELGSGPFRLWWAFRLYGHDTVRILDGGFERWVRERRPVSAGPERAKRSTSPWRARPGLPVLAGQADILAALDDPNTAVLDARPPEQFEGRVVWFETGAVPAGDDGIARTPRGPIRAGHVPGAISIPYTELYRPEGTMKPPEDLLALFEEAGLDRAARAITYCGSGISASALLFALHRAGIEDAAMYDASWEEWGRNPEAPVDLA
jgi:thiosulfate/3-mercaptopyruvate sulfurtransferase